MEEAFADMEFMVGAVGFEPTTFWSQTRRATGLRYAPSHVYNISAEAGKSSAEIIFLTRCS